MNAPRRLVSLGLLALAATAAGCSGKESIVRVGDGKEISAEEIDADPLALLPGGAVLVWRADASAMLGSSMGPQSLRAAQALVPLTPEMNFEPRRDLKSLNGAGYSVQSADVAMVAQGDFDRDAIQKAADRGAVSALGRPLQKTSYGGRDLYLTGDVGLVVLTKHTALVGNPAGLRRALDRLRDARIRRELPDWMAKLLATEKAELVLVGDLAGQSVSAAVSQQAPFVQRLEKLRMVGDFKDPGMNLAGALSYADPQAASAGNDQIRSVAQSASGLNLLFFVGVTSPLRTMQTNIQGNDVQFVAQLDGPALGNLIERSAGWIRSSSAPPAATR